MSHYIITYFNITCPSEQHFTDNGSATVNSPLTSTLIPLQSGQLYNISVRASNAVGVSPAVSETFWTPASQGMTMHELHQYLMLMFSLQLPVPLQRRSMLVQYGHPPCIDSSSIIDVSWGEVPCPYRNGEITGYVIMYWKTRERREGGGGRQGIRSRQTHNKMIMVDGHTVTIDDLDPFTEYSVIVAGVNSAGIAHLHACMHTIRDVKSTMNR